MPDPHTYNEKELLNKIAEGDEQAFELLFNKYVPILHPYLLDMVKSKQSAEDAVQNTFIRIWLYRDKLHEIDFPHTWIIRIAVRECLNILRKKSIEIRATENLQVITGTDTTYEHDIQYHQTKGFIKEAVSLLSPQRRKIYDMSRSEGLSVSEIAEKLQLSVQTVKNTLGISVELIREHLFSKGIIVPSSVAFYFFIKYL